MATSYQTPATSPAITSTSEELIKRARAIAPIIREHNSDAERNRRVAAPVLDALNRAGLQQMFAPQSLGGLEVDPLTCARVVEEVALSDSAAGWALQSGNVNAWWASRLPEQGVDEIFAASRYGIVAAAFHPPQRARETGDGFVVSGRAPLASMVHDAEWILLSAIIMDGDAPRMTEFGPAMIAFILRTSDVEVLDTWYTLGMRGTDSNDVAFTDVAVPAHRTFPLAPVYTPNKYFEGPLYRYPASPIIGLFSASVLLATARNAISTVMDLATKKTPFGSMKSISERGTAQSTIANAEADLRSARAFFHDTLREAWERTAAGETNTLEHKATLLLSAIHAVRSSAKVTDAMHRLAGSTGIYTRNPLERYFRDTSTLRHHGFVSENKLEAIGQVYLGLPPDFPLLAF
jgi:alkylation response protein AidB-like acyl-CoA dehydrogenase